MMQITKLTNKLNTITMDLIASLDVPSLLEEREREKSNL